MMNKEWGLWILGSIRWLSTVVFLCPGMCHQRGTLAVYYALTGNNVSAVRGLATAALVVVAGVRSAGVGLAALQRIQGRYAINGFRVHAFLRPPNMPSPWHALASGCALAVAASRLCFSIRTVRGKTYKLFFGENGVENAAKCGQTWQNMEQHGKPWKTVEKFGERCISGLDLCVRGQAWHPASKWDSCGSWWCTCCFVSHICLNLVPCVRSAPFLFMSMQAAMSNDNFTVRKAVCYVKFSLLLTFPRSPLLPSPRLSLRKASGLWCLDVWVFPPCPRVLPLFSPVFPAFSHFFCIFPCVFLVFPLQHNTGVFPQLWREVALALANVEACFLCTPPPPLVQVAVVHHG